MKALNIDIVWGGIYTSKSEDSDSFSVFRLLDFYQDAYHASLYTEEFSAQPTFDEVKDLSPWIGHIPMDTRALFQETDLTLIGRAPLSHDDFEGYAIYLEEQGVSAEEIDSLVAKLIDFSVQQPPLEARMTLEGDDIFITPRTE